MTLPFVSRLAYQQAVERYTRAEAQVDRLLEHTQRMDRVAAGLPERARQPVEVPDEIAEEIALWGDDSGPTQESLRAQAVSAIRRGVNPKAILAQLRKAREGE